MEKRKKKVTGYDKYVDWKMFSIPVILLFAILLIPTPYGMKDVGTEYRVAPGKVINLVTIELFGCASSDAEQWQILTARIMEQNMKMGALTKKRFAKRNFKWVKQNKISNDEKNFNRARAYVIEKVDDEVYASLMKKAMALRKTGLKYEDLQGQDKKEADRGAWHIKVAIAMGAFVVLCFLTECIPLARGLLLHRPDPGLHRRGIAQTGGHALLGRRLLVYHGQPHVRRRLCQDRCGQAGLPDDVSQTGRS